MYFCYFILSKSTLHFFCRGESGVKTHDHIFRGGDHVSQKRNDGIFLIIFLFGVPVDCAAGENADDLIMKLKRMVEKQQEQLEIQQKQIETLMKQVEALKDVTLPSEKVAELPKDLVRSTGDKVSARIYGQVNRGLLYVNDGENSDLMFVDNDNSSTRIGFLGNARLNDDLTAGARIEVQFESNSTAAVSQDDQSVGPNNFTERHLDLFFESKAYGKLSIGQGSTASDSTSEVDLSGTDVVGYSSISDLAGGIKFYDTAADTLSNVRIGDVVSNMDGLSRKDRLRYDTPTFAGLVLSTSLVEDEQQDLAIRYSRKFQGTKIAAAIAYANTEASSTVKNQFNGSVSALIDSGLNATFAAGYQDTDAANRDDPIFYYIKLGYILNIFDMGSTALALDYGRFNDIAQNDDEVDTIGAFAVQNLTNWGTELYLGYRYHSLDRSGFDYDDIHVILSGARIKF